MRRILMTSVSIRPLADWDDAYGNFSLTYRLR